MTPRRMALPALQAAFAVAVLGVVAIGCNGSLPFGSANDASATQAADRIHQQANDALHRWADAVRNSGGATVSFTTARTSQIGDWESAVAGNDKVALLSGMLVAPTPLSDAVPARGKVAWVDGSSVDVDVLTAAAALADLVADGAGDCGDCSALIVTDANLATSLVQTSVGPAEVPVWVFTIKGTAVRVTRVAVDPSVTVVPPPYNADHPPDGISIDAAYGKADSRKLTVEFTWCGATDYAAEAVESDLAVVVIISPNAPESSPQSGCARLAGASKSLTVTLADPLGKRAVLEVRQGLPVPVNPS